MLSFWTWESLTGININVVILAVNVLIFWAILIFTELNITKLLWIKIKEMVYGSKVAVPQNVDSDVKLEKDTVFQVLFDFHSEYSFSKMICRRTMQ